MAQIHKELRKKEPTSLHVDLTKYIKATTGHDADLETVKLALMIGPLYRASEENAARRERDEAAREKIEQARLDEIEARKQAIVDRKAAAKAERAERLRAKLAELEADEDDAPAPRKSAPVKATKAPAKKVAAKVVPIKRAAKAVAPTPERGGLRESEESFDDEVEPY